jgi:hypothetical protein
VRPVVDEDSCCLANTDSNTAIFRVLDFFVVADSRRIWSAPALWRKDASLQGFSLLGIGFAEEVTFFPVYVRRRAM